MTRLTAVVLFASVIAFPAFGQLRVVQEPDRQLFRQRSAVDFTDVTLEAEVRKPVDSYQLGRPGRSFRNLIKVRMDFVPELQRSVDAL